MRWSFRWLAPLFVLGCGSDDSSSERIAAACGKIMDATCAKLVECRATQSGTPYTADACARIRSQAVASCQSKEGAAIAAATDTDVDQCATELSQTACTAICNQVPQDPPTCHKISPDPNTSVITCAQ